MLASLAADLLVSLHLGFILFVVLGGLLALRWPRAAWAHVPAALWGAVVEIQGWVCPLTPLEQRLRVLAGESGFEGSFIDHYITPLVYPGDITPRLGLALGLAVIAVNVMIYGFVAWRARRPRRR